MPTARTDSPKNESGQLSGGCASARQLARQRYQSGVASFIDVLDAERTEEENELSLADATTAVSTDLVQLYRALGGGWESGGSAGSVPAP